LARTVILVVIGSVVVLSWVILACRWLKENPASAAPPEPPAPLEFLGGIRSLDTSVTGKLGRLELFDWGVRVRGSETILVLMIPVWHARYEDLAKAQLVTFPIANPGVRLLRRNGGDPVIFVTRHGEQVLDQLERRGVPVDRKVSRLGFTTALSPWLDPPPSSQAPKTR
jgi:hypothetical protein